MAVNKVVYGETTIMDITDTTATASDVAEGKVFYDRAGVRALGTGSGGGEEEMFIATYGTTTYAEVLQAITDGKIIVVDHPDTGQVVISSADRTTFPVPAGPTIYLRAFYVNYAHNSFSTYFMVSSDDTWSWSTSLLALQSAVNLKMNKVTNATNGNVAIFNTDGSVRDSGLILQEATDTDTGTIKLNQSESVTLNANGQLQVGGRLGQYPDGGVFYPTDIEPSGVGASSFLITDGAKGVKLSTRSFAIMAGANVTTKSTAPGATQYRVSNTQANRLALYAVQGGRIALNQTDAMQNGTALITSIKFANGNNIAPYFGPTENDNDIIITASRSVNPNTTITAVRVYGTNATSDNILIGQGVGAGGGKGISLGQSTYFSGNQCVAIGNSVIVTANNSVGFGHTHYVPKQYCFVAGQGHDFTNAGNGATAVGTWSSVGSKTKFAVGNGTGNDARSNALEVISDNGTGLIIKSPNGTKYKIAVDDSGNLTTTPA